MYSNIKLRKVLKSINIILFIIYIVLLFKIILFKYSYSAHVSINNLISSSLIKSRSLNLIPFKTIRNFNYITSHQGFRWGISNTCGNLIVFIPLGYLLPTIIKKYEKFLYLLITVIFFSTFFEVFQYIFKLGSSDIDDVILNTLGGIVGYALFRFISKYILNKNALYITTILLTFFFFTGGFIVAKNEFGNMLGITKFKEISIGGEDIPKTPANFFGSFIKGDSSLITMSDYVGRTNKNYSVATFNNKEKSSESNTVEVVVDQYTKLYSEKDSHKKNKMTRKFSKCSMGKIEQIPKESQITVWGKNVGDKFQAGVIVFNETVNKADNGDVVIGNANNKENKNSNVKGQDEEDLSGEVKEINGDEIVIYKHEKIKQTDGDVIISGNKNNTAKIRVSNNTNITIRNVYNNGMSPSKNEQGAIKDLKIKSSIYVWGNKQIEYWQAEKIVIYVIH